MSQIVAYEKGMKMATKFLKKLSVAIACLGIGVLVGGCAIQAMPKMTAKEAENYLVEKYGDTFFLEGYEQSDYLPATDAIVFKSDRMIEGLQETAHLYITSDHKGIHFSDDYFFYVIRPELEEMVLSLFQTEFEDVKVRARHTNSRIDDRLTKDSTLEDFFGVEQDYRLHPIVYLRETPGMTNAENHEKYERLMEQFRDKYNTWSFHICIVPGDVYDTEDFDSWNVLATNMDKVKESEFITIYYDKITFKSDRDEE